MALLCVSTTARADTTAIAAGFDAQAVPEAGGYGWIFLHHDREHLLPRGARLVVEFNSDKLVLSIDRIRAGRVELAASLYGEALLAWVMIDYYRDGRDERDKGFFASDIGATVSAKVNLEPSFVELVVGARRWFTTRDPATNAALVMPDDPWVGEARLRYTFWHLLPDPSLWEPQRFWWRVRGVAFGFEASADLRDRASPWGAIDTRTFGLADPRNDPSRTIFGAHQWLRAGVQLHDRVRLQLREEAHWLWGADDLVRVRIGGQNPWSVPLVGAPLGGYLADRVLGAEGSIHVRIKNAHELGVLVDAVVMPDVRRVGDDERVNVLAGVGAFADLRWKQLQLDVRAGWSPTLQPGRLAGGYGLCVGLGWSR